MKCKKIAALCSCFSLVGSLMSPMAAGAVCVESETALYEEVQTEEAGSESGTESNPEEIPETEREETEKPETEEQTPSTEEMESESGSETRTENGNESESEIGTEAGTEPDTEEDTELGTESGTENLTEETTEQTPSENVTEEGTEGTTEAGTEGNTETQHPEEIETENSSETESEAESEMESETEEEPEEETAPSFGYGYEASSNYFWDPSWYISPDFRFTQVDKKCAIVESEQDLVCVYDSASEEGTVVGRIPYFGLVFVLEEGEEWTYIESGTVRGFIQTYALKTGEYADLMMQSIGEYSFKFGISEVAAYENKAFTYTHTTTKDVVATKQYGIALYPFEILEYPEETARAIGQAVTGDLMYILEVAENGWYYVESGDVRGFADPSLLASGDLAESYVDQKQKEEEELQFVEELVEPLENESLYYTLKSVRVAGSTVETDVAETAMSFVGKLPYVWGGNSLTYGADCSGFVQSVFSAYGVVLPRTAEAQGINGIEITSLSEAKAGDVVYYGSGPHVGIYVGNGMVVQCAGNSGNTATNLGKGVTLSAVDFMPITSIRRYLIETEDTDGENGNRLDLTEYSQEQLELIWAIVAQEDNGSYEGALAVISSAMNRTESSTWGFEGSNALAQLMAPGQYCYSMDEYWRSRLNGNVPGYVKAAVNDCLKKGIRNHSYTCFRSMLGAATGSGAVQIGGNWYFGA